MFKNSKDRKPLLARISLLLIFLSLSTCILSFEIISVPLTANYNKEIVSLQLNVISGTERISEKTTSESSNYPSWDPFSLSALGGFVISIITYMLFRKEREYITVYRLVYFLITVIAIIIISPFVLILQLLLGPRPELHLYKDIPGYRVKIVQYWTDYESTNLDFVAIRYDGKQYHEYIDGSLNQVCSTLSTTRIGSRTYFLCDDEIISEKTSYVDEERLVIYVGRGGSKLEKPLSSLFFRESSP